ncbi:hypothetical protein ECDEC10A_1749 [Escherichia coli DEC10A]|nr:hypothetical protein ECDEC10A_1749 [Escherichia coli DEC10A]
MDPGEAVLTTQKRKFALALMSGKTNSVSHCRRLFGEDRQG